MKTTQERVLAAVGEHTTSGCWLVTPGRLLTTGYGRITVNGKAHLAHRLSYETFVGPIPTGLQLDHLCRVRSCINPEHLEPVTSAENSFRSPLTRASINRAQTHCPSGHEYSPENTYSYSYGRRCKRCVSEQSARRYRARRAAQTADVA